MIHPDAIFGRLGNRMFQGAFLFAEAMRRQTDFYYQDPEYFKGYEEQIKTLFGTGIGYLEQVGIHIRRGGNPSRPEEPNYSENPFYVNLTETDYYERAMALFPDDDFVIFTDDPEWCKKKYKGDRIQIMERGNDVEDFNLLASCKHQIIANSSFSWWAAYLNPNPSKRIIAPKQWYSDGVERTKCPPEWERI